MILVTGGAGFIGSNLINHLLKKNLKQELISVDWKNNKNRDYFISESVKKISPDKLNVFLKTNQKKINLIIHLGAITSTTEKNIDLIIENNIKLSILLWDWCVKKKKRFIYASSAATYGDGSEKFSDSEKEKYLHKLFPLNIYGWSKHTFDKFIFKKKSQKIMPPQCVGMKFFNVYGPNENHKKEMRSIVLKTFQNIKKNKQVKLFKSHNTSYKDGEQLRDFIYVKDVVKIIQWFINKPKINGLFNVGSGIPRSFNDLVSSVFKNSNSKKKITYINTPKNIREQYQYFTCADMSKLKSIGYRKKTSSLEEGIKDYITNHLKKE